MRKLFGTDGVRGTANAELSPLLALKLGSASALVLRRKHKGAKILIGRDPRISGDILESAMAAGICSMGVDVYLTGIISTPAVSFLTKLINADAGVVISASHNPMKDNGIKFFGSDGYKLPDEIESEIENNLEGFDDFHRPKGADVGRMYHSHDLAFKYLDHIKDSIPLDLSGLKIVLDCANGALSEFAPILFTSLGAEIFPTNCEPDGININENCGSLYPKKLQDVVLKYKAHIGLAFDGDGDRAIMVDEKGRTVDGDHVMAICAIHLAEKGMLRNNSVVATVMSNIGLEAALRDKKILLIRTKVGDRYVSDEMRKSDISIGGEKSGHLIFSDYSATGDGLITALQVLKTMLESAKPLSELADQMKEYPQLLINIPVKTMSNWEKNPAISEIIKQGEISLAGKGRVFVRASGTERLIRVMAEGPDLNELEKITSMISNVVRTELG
ncbi:MAG: phosphoglucosamine mutase [Armatimonadota bacterium]